MIAATASSVAGSFGATPKRSPSTTREARTEVLDPRQLGGLSEVDEPLAVGMRKRAEQDASHDAEDRGVGADPEREREDGRDREEGCAREAPRRIAHVPKELPHPSPFEIRQNVRTASTEASDHRLTDRGAPDMSYLTREAGS